MEKHYLPGLDEESCIGFSLDYGGKKKPSAKVAKEYLKSLLPAVDSLGITTLYCADGEYFKKLIKDTKAEPHLGYVKPCAIEGFEHINIIYGINYQSLFVTPDNQKKLDQSTKTLRDFLDGNYVAPGSSIIHSESYPKTFSDIKEAIASLHQYPVLTADIEAFSLEFWKAGLGTIGFAWDQHNGTAFCCDYQDAEAIRKTEALIDLQEQAPALLPNGEYIVNEPVRLLLKEFFETYKGKLIWHNANFDLKLIVYVLWMKDHLDYDGMLEGIEVMTRLFDDTKLLTYLATNSCAGNKLSLKEQSHEFAGNYAQAEINNIRFIPRKDLLRYNLVDCLSTWFVYNKHNPTVDKDNQRDVYNDLFHPAVKQILQMELVGMPLHMPSVVKADIRMKRIRRRYSDFLVNALETSGFMQIRREEEVHLYNTTRKKKRKTLDDFKDLEFNPGSPKQLAHLLYTIWELPVLDKTDTGEPATGNKVLSKLVNHTDNPTHKQVLRCLVGLSKVDKILSAFMPKFLDAIPVGDGSHRLYGGFNIGGTVSGRLSSSKPNLICRAL